MSVFAGQSEWEHLPPGWIWLCDCDADYEAAKGRGVLSTVAENGVLSIIDHEFADVLRGWTVVVPYTPDTAEEALQVAKVLHRQSSVRLVLVPEIPEATERTFRLWLMTLSVETGCPKAGLYRAVRNVVPYFPGWEHVGRFEQLQRQKLEAIRKNCKPMDLNMMRDMLRKKTDALFDGLKIDTMTDSAADACAGIQYIVEELMGLEKAGKFAERAANGS